MLNENQEEIKSLCLVQHICAFILQKNKTRPANITTSLNTFSYMYQRHWGEFPNTSDCENGSCTAFNEYFYQL